MIKRVWKEGILPADWRKSLIVPLYKRGDTDRVDNYRGISLLCSAYKIYTEIIRNRMDSEVEEKNMLPESQAGFRKGRSTLDNIYVLSHVIQREKEKKKERKEVYALFVDLKAAFDNVDRSKLWNLLEIKGMSMNLIWRMKKIYEDTEAAVRTTEGVTKGFNIRKGVRQGCVLSPTLFNLYIADLDYELSKRNVGGVALGKDRL